MSSLLSSLLSSSSDSGSSLWWWIMSIPGWCLEVLQPYGTVMASQGAAVWEFVQQQQQAMVEWPGMLYEAIPRNALVPLLAIVLVFWPLLVTLLTAFMTASTWIIWLLTSVLLGCVQLLYVTYQFIMITCDLCGLSVLKSYSLARNAVLTHLGVDAWFASQAHLRRKSTRRQWRERLETAETYENFLKIRIEPKEEATVFLEESASSSNQKHHVLNGKNGGGSNKSAEKKKDPATDSALPPLPPKIQQNHAASLSSMSSSSSSLPPRPGQARRRRSFDGKQNTNGGSSSPPLSPSSLGVPMTKSRSFGNFPQFFQQSNSNNSSKTGGTSKMEHANIDPVVSQELGERTAYLLVTTTERLLDARRQAECHPQEEACWSRLKYLLSAVVKRNHLQLDDVLVDNARTVSHTGRYGLTSQSRQVIRAFYEQVQKGLDLIADGPAVVPQQQQKTETVSQPQPYNHSSSLLSATTITEASPSPTSSPRSSTSSLEDTAMMELLGHNDELSDRLRVLRKMKQNMGRTALMLSGGGAQAMYHIGTIRGLIQSKLYHDIQVISGTSGGSIAAAMCAMKTPEELFNEVCVPTVSTDFGLTGEQGRQNIRWFPTIMEMASYWLKHKLLMDKDEFRRTCEFYYGDMTFEEAFERTGKHVCITVSASRASSHHDSDSAQQRLLLNHISTPRVTLASAVAASCALPGVMAPAKLLTKNHKKKSRMRQHHQQQQHDNDESEHDNDPGNSEEDDDHQLLEPFEVDGVEWIDGSVQADLPFQRISTLFCVSNFIVSQTNFHIVPFLNKAHHPNPKSLYWRLFQTMEWDIRSRALKLSRLGLFPRIFGQDISKVFKQKYHGNLTIVPRFTTMQTFGLNALSNPTVDDMKGYIKYGEIATWPYLNAIRDMIRLEKVIDECLTRLEQRVGKMHGGNANNPNMSNEWYDDIESIASGSHNRFLGTGGASLNSSSARVKISLGPQVRHTLLSSASSNNSHAAAAAEQLQMKRHAKKLEEENKALKEQLQRLEQQLLQQQQQQQEQKHANGEVENGENNKKEQ